MTPARTWLTLPPLLVLMLVALVMLTVLVAYISHRLAERRKNRNAVLPRIADTEWDWEGDFASAPAVSHGLSRSEQAKVLEALA